MKKFILLSVISALPVGLMAQDDDMYFVPTKENVAKEAAAYGIPKDTYYSGSHRSVDDYNRRAWTVVEPIDSAGNDIIDFSAVRGVYPDSAYTEVTDNDYQLTRQMSRFDDYTPSQAFWDGYRAGRWSSPWYSSWYPWYDYDPWYWDSWYWNDPWYYSGWYGGWYSPWHYSGWYSPWRYGYYGYHGYYGGGWHSGRPYGTSGRSWSRTGVSHHKAITGRPRTSSSHNLGGYRSSTYSNGTQSARTYSTPSGNLGGTRSSGWTGGSSSSGGSFSGGSHSSGGSSGGGRSVGGGHSYGGRR